MGKPQEDEAALISDESDVESGQLGSGLPLTCLGCLFAACSDGAAEKEENSSEVEESVRGDGDHTDDHLLPARLLLLVFSYPYWPIEKGENPALRIVNEPLLPAEYAKTLERPQEQPKAPPGGRYDEKLDWSFGALNLFRNNASRNKEPFNGYNATLVFSKGYVESTLSRAMVDFMVHELDLTELVRRIELKSFGIDELMIPTLHAADALAAPGGFTHHCLSKGIRAQHITRKSVWSSTEDCYTGQMRHAICIFGVEDLRDHVAKFPRYLKDANGVVSKEKLEKFDCEGRKIPVAG
ncbi:hypothetical protein M3Y99_01444500 [Aphelenchoides fujianensis]|nr:hypothetical protein M3Y99_01444500 [Aphelenchoides fujianensis]